MYRIPLRVSGVDLEDDQTIEVIGASLSDLTWYELAGAVVATLRVDCNEPVGAAVEAARRILHSLPGSDVTQVEQEIVAISDIASRLGISREAVRLWVEGRRGPGNFPGPEGVVSNGKSKVWFWADVNKWLEENYRLGDGDKYLTRREIAELNATLLRIKQHIDAEWETISSYGQRLVHEDAGHQPHRPWLLVADRSVPTRIRSNLDWALSIVSRSPIVAYYGEPDPDALYGRVVVEESG
jgi:hypothetical protein